MVKTGLVIILLLVVVVTLGVVVYLALNHSSTPSKTGQLNDKCDDKHKCGSTLTCDGGKCKLELGQPCTSLTDCVSSTVACSGTPAVCTNSPGGTLNQPCQAGVCNTGLVCTTDTICKLDTGQPCGASGDCASGQCQTVCVGGSTGSGLGQSCGTCTLGLTCSAGYCQQTGAVTGTEWAYCGSGGASCGTGLTCRNNLCISNTKWCGSGGVSCRAGFGCSNGLCTFDGINTSTCPTGWSAPDGICLANVNYPPPMCFIPGPTCQMSMFQRVYQLDYSTGVNITQYTHPLGLSPGGDVVNITRVFVSATIPYVFTSNYGFIQYDNQLWKFYPGTYDFVDSQGVRLKIVDGVVTGARLFGLYRVGDSYNNFYEIDQNTLAVTPLFTGQITVGGVGYTPTAFDLQLTGSMITIVATTGSHLLLYDGATWSVQARVAGQPRYIKGLPLGLQPGYATRNANVITIGSLRWSPQSGDILSYDMYYADGQIQTLVALQEGSSVRLAGGPIGFGTRTGITTLFGGGQVVYTDPTIQVMSAYYQTGN